MDYRHKRILVIFAGVIVFWLVSSRDSEETDVLKTNPVIQMPTVPEYVKYNRCMFGGSAIIIPVFVHVPAPSSRLSTGRTILNLVHRSPASKKLAGCRFKARHTVKIAAFVNGSKNTACVVVPSWITCPLVKRIFPVPTSRRCSG
jgi:predicted butyrate kinase (DUF1464 family)